MQVRVLYFGVLKELLKREGERVELPTPASVATLLETVRKARPESGKVWATLAVAVNGEYADVDCALHEGDEVALLPPVSGGVEPDIPDNLARELWDTEATPTRSEFFDSAFRDQATRCFAQDDGSVGEFVSLAGRRPPR